VVQKQDLISNEKHSQPSIHYLIEMEAEQAFCNISKGFSEDMRLKKRPDICEVLMIASTVSYMI
jgi:hypothetical protein